MLSAEPARLTDSLWLAAHDSVKGTPQIGEWALGVGLATALLAELVHGGFLELCDGELFDTAAALPDDPALQPVLIKMRAEEQSWQPPTQLPSVGASVRTAAPARQGHDWPAQGHDDRRRPAAAQHGWDWPSQTPDVREQRLTPPQDESRHYRRGHQLSDWLSYLAYERRAQDRVTERLARSGLVRWEERRRLFGGTTTSYVPHDSVAAATPANLINIAVQNRQRLDRSQLLLAGLLLATGLHHHALATLSAADRAYLADNLKRRLDDTSRALLRAADASIAGAAMR